MIFRRWILCFWIFFHFSLPEGDRFGEQRTISPPYYRAYWKVPFISLSLQLTHCKLQPGTLNPEPTSCARSSPSCTFKALSTASWPQRQAADGYQIYLDTSLQKIHEPTCFTEPSDLMWGWPRRPRCRQIYRGAAAHGRSTAFFTRMDGCNVRRTCWNIICCIYWDISIGRVGGCVSYVSMYIDLLFQACQ